MKLKTVFFILVSTILLSSCRKDKMEIRYSVLGDSYSALDGYLDPETNDPWPHFGDIGVTQPEQMWWYQVGDVMKWEMDKNNSFSGSLICNLNYVNYYGPHSFIRRMDELGNPNVIFVFGGTNDAYVGAPLGDYVYADWTDEQLCEFRPALAYLLDHLQQRHPGAKLYLMIDMDLGSGGIDDSIRDAFIASMHHVADHYHVVTIDLYNIYKNSWHPNVKGQERIANQVIEVVKANFNV